MSHRYRTEIVVAADRLVVLQLPADIPEGRAFVTVQSVEGVEADVAEAESDRVDIDWFEEAEEPEV